VHLSDGSTALERLTQYDAGRYFSYTVSAFTGVLRLMTPSADGEWWFEESPTAGSTRVIWRYAFYVRTAWTGPTLWLITHFLWRRYMRKAIALCKRQIESAGAQANFPEATPLTAKGIDVRR
jgi:hypothetical protein